MSLANLKPKRTAEASRGFPATARLSCTTLLSCCRTTAVILRLRLRIVIITKTRLQTNNNPAACLSLNTFICRLFRLQWQIADGATVAVGFLWFNVLTSSTITYLLTNLTALSRLSVGEDFVVFRSCLSYPSNFRSILSFYLKFHSRLFKVVYVTDQRMGE